MAIRLLEEEVHAACAEIASQGERPTSLTLLDKLGRGSLTTITKYLNSWNASGNAQAIDAESLPAVIKLPESLSKEGEDLLKKMWNVAKNLTDAELEIQREALKQAEIENREKVEEAFKFSEAQAIKIDRIEEEINVINNQLDTELTEHKKTASQLNEADKVNVGLSKDNEQLKNEILELKKQIVALEDTNKAVNQSKQVLQENHTKDIQQKDSEIKGLDTQGTKLQASLEQAVKSHDQLKSDIKNKESELSGRIIELEKVGVRYESSMTDLDLVKTDLTKTKAELSERSVELEKVKVRYETSTEELKTLKADYQKANKIAGDADKMVSNLEGQLAVYKSFDTADKK